MRGLIEKEEDKVVREEGREKGGKEG